MPSGPRLVSGPCFLRLFSLSSLSYLPVPVLRPSGRHAMSMVPPWRIPPPPRSPFRSVAALRRRGPSATSAPELPCRTYLGQCPGRPHPKPASAQIMAIWEPVIPSAGDGTDLHHRLYSGDRGRPPGHERFSPLGLSR